MSAVGIAVGVGVAVGLTGGILGSVRAAHIETAAGKKADAEWAANRPSRQPTIDRANAFVDDMASRFDPTAKVHTDGGVHTVAIYDPTHTAEKYLSQHEADIPANVSRSADATYVRLDVHESTRAAVRDGSQALGMPLFGSMGAMAVGGALAALTHGWPRTIGIGLGAAGAAGFFATFMGAGFMPESPLEL